MVVTRILRTNGYGNFVERYYHPTQPEKGRCYKSCPDIRILQDQITDICKQFSKKDHVTITLTVEIGPVLHEGNRAAPERPLSQFRLVKP